jgi:hypothetical protein
VHTLAYCAGILEQKLLPLRLGPLWFFPRLRPLASTPLDSAPSTPPTWLCCTLRAKLRPTSQHPFELHYTLLSYTSP